MLGSFWVGNLFLIALLGIATSFTDLRKGLIPNKFVFPAIAAALILNFLNGFDFAPFLVNGFLAFLLGFLFWLASLWSAGDAKLFLAFALLVPFSFYDQSSLFPAFSILVNSFVPVFILLLALVVTRTSTEQKVLALKQAFKPSLIASVAVFFFSFYWLLEISLPFLPIQLDFFTMALILFALVSAVEFLLPKKSIYFFALLCPILLFLRLEAALTIEFALFFVSFMLAILLLLFFVLRLGFSCFGKLIKVGELREGMALLEIPVLRNGKIEKKNPVLPSFVNIFSEIREKPFIEARPKGLEKKDIAKLKKAMTEGKLSFKSILVQETLPFAPLIFIGTILSFFTATFFAF